MLEWQKKKRLKKKDQIQFFAEKGDFSNNKKNPKRDQKSSLGLLRDPGLPKRHPVGSSAFLRVYLRICHQIHLSLLKGLPCFIFTPAIVAVVSVKTCQ